jgi:hypothetical protein
LRERRIEQADAAGYSLRQLVDNQLPAERTSREQSLRSYAQLQADKARLVRLQVAEKEGSMIPKKPAHLFVQSLLLGCILRLRS